MPSQVGSEEVAKALDALWEALAELGYIVGVAEGQPSGSGPDAQAFRMRMTEARHVITALRGESSSLDPP